MTVVAWLALVLVLAPARLAWTEPPEVDHLFPAGGQRETAVAVTVAGTFTEWPVRIWTDDPGLAFEAGEGLGQLRASINSRARLGPHLVRLYHADGASAPCLFVVGDNPELVELGSAERRGAGETVRSLPLTAHGRLGQSGEPGAYRLALEAGQVLQAELTATGLDSPRTARLRLLDPAGETVAETTNHPPEDPFLDARVHATGIHRLLVGDTRTHPAAGPAATGSDGSGVYRLVLRVRAVQRPSAVPNTVLYESPEIPGVSASVVVRAGAEWAEAQHPDTLPPTVESPSSFTGFINPAGDEDRFSFLARRDEVHRFLIQAASIESPLAPVLRVLDEVHRILAEARSEPGSDASLDWLAPWDGNFTLSVGDATDSGGPDYRYQLDILAPEPYLAAEVAGHTWRLRPGDGVTIPLKLRRPATHRRVLTATANGLPDGVTASTGLITPDGVAAEVRLTVASDASPASQPFQITLLDASAIPARFLTARAPLRGRHAPPGALLLNDTETLWLTILPAADD